VPCSQSKLKPDLRNGQINGPLEPVNVYSHTQAIVLQLITGISTGTSNVSSPYLLGAARRLQFVP
jgi:hypothetical protein